MQNFLGTWSLVSATAHDSEGNTLPLPYGPAPFGLIMFRGARMLCVVCYDGAEIPNGTSRPYSSYGGPFTLDGSMLCTIVDVASDPNRIGSHEVREAYVREDGHLVIKKRLANGVIRELLWVELKKAEP